MPEGLSLATEHKFQCLLFCFLIIHVGLISLHVEQASLAITDLYAHGLVNNHQSSVLKLLLFFLFFLFLNVFLVRQCSSSVLLVSRSQQQEVEER